jgi:DNA invertase Pin-like site-specific DNA recombinase
MTPATPGAFHFNILATFAEFEVDLPRILEGMAIARAKRRLKGKAPKLSPTQRKVLLKLHAAGEHSIAALAELFSISPRHRLPRNRTNARQKVRRRRSLSDGT